MMKNIIHFMPINSPIFNRSLIKLINKNTQSCCSHIFVMSDKATYDILSKVYDNLKYVPQITLKMVNDSDRFDKIILHSLFLDNFRILQIKDSVVKKIVWCVWGHDLYRKISWKGKRNIIKNLLVECISTLFVGFKLRKLKAVAAGFQGDVYKIKEICGSNMPIIQAPYTSGYYKDDIDKLIINNVSDDNPIRIMIGHSGHPFLQHKKYLDMLSKYKAKNIKIVLPLAYGSKSYIEDVVSYAHNIYDDNKLELVLEFMSWKEYIPFISKINIAIFDYDHQAALGNIFLLSYLNKKIYLPITGVIYKELISNNIKVYNCSKIASSSFDEFIHNEENTNKKYFDNFYDQHSVVLAWNRLFDI